ncbi:cell division protein SepF [Coprococcus catus]|uniref:cell division protein SepF n=1 Tax=Coprococcus catus TaxID=116085 RepID=UPI001C02A09B|nr:cell division protein SepF [Coprococcus catus]MBT9771649.1 cell division protein SepF [Coprococcus catus]
MSKGFNKILDFMKLNDDEYEDYEEYDEEIEDEEEAEEHAKRKKAAGAEKTTFRTRHTTAKQDDGLDSYADLDDEPAPKSTHSNYSSSRSSRKSTPYGRNSKIVPMHTASRSMEVCVSKPNDFNACQEICDIIQSGRAAIINFEAVTTQEAQRIIDFVSGSCYAINGNIKQISETIVIVTPEDIDITGDLQELASSNVNVPAFGYSEEE